MSYTKRTSNSNTTKKTYCKVCHDAGKSEEEYTSHYVRSEPGPKGKVICPILLAMICSYCSKNSHTISYCPEIKAKNKNDKKQNYKDVLVSKEKGNENPSKKRNLFEYLQEEENIKVKVNVKDKNQKSKENKKEEFPELTSKKPTVKVATISYKNIIDQHVNDNKYIVENVFISKSNRQKTKMNVEEKKPVKIVVMEKKKRNWADYSSSDDEEDDGDMYDYKEYKYFQSVNLGELDSNNDDYDENAY